jgi:hypothetical protein
VTFATEPQVVADQAAAVAAAWSAPGAPSSWRLTAAQFQALRDDEELLAIAAMIPPDKLPALLFQAAASFLVLELKPRPLRDWFPRLGQPQPPLDRRSGGEYGSFCLEHRNRLLELSAIHRYQMNEVGRCAGLVPALVPACADGRELAVVDLGTGAGLALHFDRYSYRFRGPGDRVLMTGDPGSPVSLETEVHGELPPPIPAGLPRVVERIGIDVEPLDARDLDVLAWLAACIPQEISAVTRFHRAVEVATRHPARMVKGDALQVLPDVLEGIPDERLVCLTDTYVNVFFTPDQLRLFQALLADTGRARDLDWISIDPLVPLGSTATRNVLGLSTPPALLERNRRGGVFGVIGRLAYREGHRTGKLLGLAYPGAAWLEWLTPPAT